VINRFIDNTFNANFTPSVGVEFRYCTFETDPPNPKKLKIQIWDTAGQEKFRSIAVQFYRGANGVIIVFDITNRTSWKNVPYWVEQVKKYNTQNYTMLLVGNKCDLHDQRVVTTEEAQQLANEWGLKYIETSAKEGVNIDTAFKALIVQCLEKIKTGGNLQPINRMEQSFYLEAQPQPVQQSGCCSGWWGSS
jgi:small GTP-binding protein